MPVRTDQDPQARGSRLKGWRAPVAAVVAAGLVGGATTLAEGHIPFVGSTPAASGHATSGGESFTCPPAQTPDFTGTVPFQKIAGDPSAYIGKGRITVGVTERGSDFTMDTTRMEVKKPDKQAKSIVGNPGKFFSDAKHTGTPLSVVSDGEAIAFKIERVEEPCDQAKILFLSGSESLVDGKPALVVTNITD